jgi:hypothetical protein
MQALAMAFMALFLVWGCQSSGMAQQQEKNVRKSQEETNMVNKASLSKAMRPPIDLAAPTKTETATFALG